MARAFSIAAVTIGGWLVAALLLWQALRLTLFDATGPSPTVAMVLFLVGAALIPATPAVSAWLAAHYGWTVAAWILGVLAAIAAVAVAAWVVLFVTAT